METGNSVSRILWGLKSQEKDLSGRNEVLVLNDRDRLKGIMKSSLVFPRQLWGAKNVGRERRVDDLARSAQGREDPA